MYAYPPVNHREESGKTALRSSTMVHAYLLLSISMCAQPVPKYHPEGDTVRNSRAFYKC